MPFPDRLLELKCLELPEAPYSLHASERMALGCRPVFPGWAGTLAETTDNSLAKINDEAAKIGAISFEPSSAREEDCSWRKDEN
jgi:hypothetical protein